ncbi:hypothetical protein NX794_29470 [Streptomyces sp. LP11]|uniref:Secreted protein n=1 Tax=Streptomyces pyxinicus TaxID=2970331 RepID=A0ABT2B9V7_9ACTN|nr:hypothetical protein [Streptomyces sp. LP11]MCS0605307.1 hypothetical protein [Streptomyces sp. LP11]
MRRGLVHVLAWLLATAAAVTLSWWGVHSVLAGTAYDPPRALPVTAAGAPAREAKAPSSPPSSAPARDRSPAPAPSASRTPADTNRPSPSVSAPSASSASGHVKAYDTDGGRAVFELGAADATLVSATPGTGWSMQVWKTETWIRVEFARGTDRVSVFCTWHDGPPHVEIGTY